MPHKRFQTCSAQGVIDAKIAGKGYLWTENMYVYECIVSHIRETKRLLALASGLRDNFKKPN
jgi:hypothetical protein